MAHGQPRLDGSETTKDSPAIISRKRPRSAVAAFRRGKSDRTERGPSVISSVMPSLKQSVKHERTDAATIPEWGRIVLRAGSAILR
jgi:hypothetical protein